MNKIEKGMLAISLAGHDLRKLYMFVDSELIQVDQKANYSIGREMDNK